MGPRSLLLLTDPPGVAARPVLGSTVRGFFVHDLLVRDLLVRGLLVSALLLAGAVVAVVPSEAAAQDPDTVPAGPDTVRVDIPPPLDTLQADTLRADEAGADTLAADTVPVDTVVTLLPPLPEPVEAGWARGVWVWDREDLLAIRALTLEELLADVPGAVPLRGGDYGTPRVVSAFGLTGGRIRVVRDGVEVVPLGGVPDLAMISMAGVERIRVERHPGEVRVEITMLRVDDPRPYSRVEAATGDSDTNLFRGSFSHPRAFGGGAAVALERLDTRGRGQGERSSATGGWVRYERTWAERWGLAAEVHRMTSEAEPEVFTPELTRTDWVLRARRLLGPDWTAHAFAARTQWEGKGEGDDGDFPLFEGDRDQLGAGLRREGDVLAGRADVRLFRGEGLPTWTGEAEVRGSLPSLGGAAASGVWEGWEDGGAVRVRLLGWTREWRGLSAFGSLETGESASPFVRSTVDRGGVFPAGRTRPLVPLRSERDAVRLGARFHWRGVELEGAWLSLDADPLVPLGLPMEAALPLDTDSPHPEEIPVDSTDFVVPGGSVTGFEVQGRIPLLLLDGLRLEGWWQGWEEGLRYLPEHDYHARIAFHDVFLPTENFELWVALGVRGRDPMEVSVPAEAVPEFPAGPRGGAVVPFHQSWYGRIQIRIVTVNAFVQWDNFTVRQNLQDFPGRLLPATRAVYGVRWTLWN